MFGFRKENHVAKKRIDTFVVLFFVMIFLLCTGIAKLYHFGGESVVEKGQLAGKISWGIDADVGRLIQSSTKLYEAVISGGYLLDHRADIDKVINIISKNKSIEKYVAQYKPKYLPLYGFAKQLVPYKDQIIQLLGGDRPRNYLVALMNAAEVRPNGGFFGSYAIIKVDKGKIISHEVYDSYYAYHQNTGVRIPLDQTYQKIIGQQSINFISPNMFGFTDIDAENIKVLYEQLFPSQHIDGVIMLKSEMLKQLLPEIKNKLIERQFTNASVDLIRGQKLPNKKEKYLSDMGSFLESNQSQLMSQIISHFSSILSGGSIQVYIPNADKSFKQFLVDQGLSVNHNQNDFFMWHINKSYNKIDSFVTRKSLFQSVDGSIVADSDGDILKLDIDKLQPGDYELTTYYNVSIPQLYEDQIYGLTKKYDVTLTDREIHILGLSYNFHNQVVMYIPDGFQFLSLKGDVIPNKLFPNDKRSSLGYETFNYQNNQIVSYDVMSMGNDVMRVVKIGLRKL